MDTGINKRIAIGAGWMISLRWLDRFIGLVSIAILARLLPPSEFGLVGYAMVFLATLDQLSMFNFQTVLVRDQDAPAARYNTAWTLDVIKGLVLSVILVATASLVADFFNEPKVEEILYWVAIIPILKGFVNVGVVDFQKNIELHKAFYLNISVRLAGSILTIVLALLLKDYWALVYGWLLRATLRLILSYVMSDYRPRFGLSERSRVLGFSVWLLAHNIFLSGNLQLPVIVIGRFFEAQALALFNMAKELTTLTSTQFTAPIRHALFPGIAKMQDNPERMESTLTSALGIIVLIALPATVGIGIVAPLLVPIVLGEQWIDAAPVVTALAISAAVQIFYPNSSVMFYALNRPEITARIAFFRLCVLAPAILYVVPRFGVLGAAWTLVTVNALMIAVDYLVLFNMSGIRLHRIVSAVWRSTVAVIAMVACVLAVLHFPFAPFVASSPILHLSLCAAVGAVVYTTTVWILWLLSGLPAGPEAYVWRILKGAYSRKVLFAAKRQA